jgi:poly(3-hydroxyoctanoate) depolymerase
VSDGPRPLERARRVEDEVRTIGVLGQEITVSVRSGSRPSARPVLMLTGLGADAAMWGSFRDRLAERVGTTVALDMPGIGASRPPLVPLPLPLLASITERVLTALGFDDVDVLGLSWGGLLAQQLAVTAPRRVRRLVLANTNFGVGSLPGHWNAINTVKPFTQQPAPPLRGCLAQLASLTGWSSLPWLPLIRQPTLVLGGDDDPVAPVSNARVIAMLLPRARLIVVPAGRHLMLLERSNEIASIVAGFLTSNTGDGFAGIDR